MTPEEQKKIEEEKLKQQNETGKGDHQKKETEVDDFLSAMKEIKENSVSKEKYEKLLAERKKLVDAISKGERQSIDVDTSSEKQETSNDVAKRIIANKYKSNLEGYKDALKYRELCISEGKHDPFVPFKTNEDVSPNDVAKAEKVAEHLKECIENAGDNPRIFNGNLQRKMGK